VICSPDDESVATAKACAKALGSHVAVTRLPGDWAEIERLAQHSDDILVVVIDPSAIVGEWNGKAVDAKFEPGAIALLDSAGNLNWLVTPEIVLPDAAIVEAASAVVRSLDRSLKLREAVDRGDTEKSWVGGTCPVCEENAAAGWIDIDEAFPSGDDEPPAHPNCECELETRDAQE
jgi:hypothetical protein